MGDAAGAVPHGVSLRGGELPGDAELRDGAGVVDAKRRVVDYARSDGDVEVEE